MSEDREAIKGCFLAPLGLLAAMVLLAKRMRRSKGGAR